MIIESITQNKPAIATVVNLGVSGFHLKETEKIENPTAEAIPNNNPIIVPIVALPNAIIITPALATVIDIQTLLETFSFKNKKPKKAVMNGIADKHNKVIAAEVFVMDQIKHTIADPNPIPPIIPAFPIFK